MEQLLVNGRLIEIVRGDITAQATDAIVNAANSRLQLGAGVAGAIRSRGGPTIQQECDRIGGTPVGTAVITGGGNLPAPHVIHAVGPRMGEGDEDEKLGSAVRCSLRVAADNNLASITLPAISTGIFGFPIERAAEILIAEAKRFLSGEPGSVVLVRFCLFSNDDYQEFRSAMASCG